MKKTLSIVLAVIMLLCMVPTFTVFAAEDDFTTIDSAQEFDAFTKAINAGTYTPANNTTVKVTADLDMKDIKDFQPINKMYFRLDFDGHTISNLVVNTTGYENYSGMLAHQIHNDGGITNIKVYNCELNVTSNGWHCAGGLAGYVKWSLVTNVTLEKVTINATGDGMSQFGGVIGCLDDGSGWWRDNARDASYTLKNVVFHTGSASIGVVFGWLQNTVIVNITGITAENLTVKLTHDNYETSKIPYSGRADYTCNSFTFAEGVVPSIYFTSTATGYTDPNAPVEPAPTGDMTIALVAVAVVSLAAVTVIAKKKVTE